MLRQAAVFAVLVVAVVGALLIVPTLSPSGGPPGPGADPEDAGAGVLAQAEAAGARRDGAVAPCTKRPTTRNTGARGRLRDSSRTVLRNGARLSNARVSNLTISGTDVKVRNVRVDGRVLVTGSKVRLNRVTTRHIGISSAVNVVVANSDIGYSSEDGIHVTSDAGRLVRRVTLRYNLVHHPRPARGSHYDGTQVRGVDNMVIRCSAYRSGPFQDTMNANIYLENANGGVSDVTVARNWLFGSAWSVMVSAKSARFIRNKHGGDIHWGYCYAGSVEDLSTRGNVKVPGRRRINLCRER